VITAAVMAVAKTMTMAMLSPRSVKCFRGEDAGLGETSKGRCRAGDLITSRSWRAGRGKIRAG